MLQPGLPCAFRWSLTCIHTQAEARSKRAGAVRTRSGTQPLAIWRLLSLGCGTTCQHPALRLAEPRVTTRGYWSKAGREARSHIG
ncbi:unnamed protein product [Lampetra planeri]